MLDTEAIFYCMFSAIFIYHVLYFLVQYLVFKRIELLYYSIFLFSMVTYYYVFHAPEMFKHEFEYLKPTSAFEFSFAFSVTWLYLSFISSYLGLTPTVRLYHFIKYYKYYNVVLWVVFLIMGVFGINAKNVFTVVSVLSWPLTISTVFLLWKLNTTYSKVVLWGTTISVLTTLLSFILDRYEIYTHFKLPFYNNTPTQIGLIFDLFILGYGLSLKAAASDKKLVVSLLENQKVLETERSRFAKDLHDGLGGMLSGIKLSISSLSGSLTDAVAPKLLPPVLKQLDIAIAEMRRISHSMMPEALMKFGLMEAIEDYCDGINKSGSVKMKFAQVDMNKPLEQTMQTAIYRVVQELSNNAIKHGGAKEIFIQLAKHERGITLTVEDDGKGFDTAQLDTMKGAGLHNVQARVDYMHGRFEIQSALNEGTTVIIEIPL